MDINALEIDGSWIAQSEVLVDTRGYFREWFKLSDINAATGRSFHVEQANISESSRGTIRGIHYSLAKYGQAKWVTCVAGSIKDIVVDIRPDSNTFRRWIQIELTAHSGQAVFIGEGLGHAFMSLEDHTVVAYLTSTPFSPNEEFEINPFDSEIGIDWGTDYSNLLISEKDRLAPTLLERKKEGRLPKNAKLIKTFKI